MSIRGFWFLVGTWELVHAVDGAEVVLQGAVGVHGHVQVELRHEGKEGAGAVGVFHRPDTDAQQPVHVQHLLLEAGTQERDDGTGERGETGQRGGAQAGVAGAHLGVDGGVDPGQPPAQMVELLSKHLLALLQLLQDV